MALDLATRPGTLTHLRKSGDLAVMDPNTFEYMVIAKDGILRTFYKIDEIKQSCYWQKELLR